jgi:hypothetical protein
MADRVCLRHQHTPYTVGMVSPDNALYYLEGLDEPVRVECIDWYPIPGHAVEVLFCPYIRHLQERFNHWQLQWLQAAPCDRPEYQQKLEDIKGAMKWAIQYRVGKLLSVDDKGLAKVGFACEDREIPFNCLAVVILPKEKKSGKTQDRADIAA